MSTSASPSPPPALAQGLPARYRLRRHLASGGMASVWCAEDGTLGRQVAIKVLSDRFAHDELSVRRFKREARAAARVSAHPHVVTIFDVGDLAGPGGPGQPSPGAFMVMEYLAGGTVADAIRHTAVTQTEARRWLRQAAEALDHAHARGIVHRDIKPANFLLDQSRNLHVADFGIAHLQSEETITNAGELFGTAAYLSPEQALGQDATAASDRYAFAVAGFELLTGGRPFTAEHFAAQARQHIDAERPSASERNPNLPPSVDAVLARGMARRPEERFPSSVAFVDALDAALDAPLTARTAPSVPPLDEPVTRRLPDRRGAARTTPLSPVPPAPGRTRGRGRALALAALTLVGLGVILLVTGLGGSGNPARSAARRHAAAAGIHRTTHHRATTPSKSASTTARASAITTASSSPASASSSAAAPPTGSQLQVLGHHELLQGNYPAAIAADHRALAAASPGSLTYAYALYDLGDALLRSGNPQAAIGVLEQRLRIPNQTATVQALLNQALAASGQGSGGVDLPPGQAQHHYHGKGNGGGD